MLGNKDAGGFFAALKDSQATVFSVGFDGAAAEPAALAAVARGHFAVRRLERIYDPALVRAHYARIAREEGYWEPAAGA